jgi:hypothetical protein
MLCKLCKEELPTSKFYKGWLLCKSCWKETMRAALPSIEASPLLLENILKKIQEE